jgi:hypothetical protein
MNKPLKIGDCAGPKKARADLPRDASKRIKDFPKTRQPRKRHVFVSLYAIFKN